MAELADAPDLGSGGRPWGFKSLIAHQNGKRWERPIFFYFQVRLGMEGLEPGRARARRECPVDIRAVSGPKATGRGAEEEGCEASGQSLIAHQNGKRWEQPIFFCGMLIVRWVFFAWPHVNRKKFSMSCFYIRRLKYSAPVSELLIFSCVDVIISHIINRPLALRGWRRFI